MYATLRDGLHTAVEIDLTRGKIFVLGHNLRYLSLGITAWSDVHCGLHKLPGRPRGERS